MSSLAPGTPLFTSFNDSAALDRLRSLLTSAIDTVAATRENPGPVTPGGPDSAAAHAAKLLPELLDGRAAADPDEAMRRLFTAFATWSIDVTDPATVARMQCPPTLYATTAELVAAALNQSLHAWEAGPFALELERHVVALINGLIGYGPGAGGTITAGGSLSNIMAMLLARDEIVDRRFGTGAAKAGLSGLGVRPVVLCSSATHFSIGRGAAIAGIGEDAILRVPTDRRGQILVEETARFIADLPDTDLPVILVACAGSTDIGWSDPIPQLCELARRHGIWLHADAAYGGGALFSQQRRHLLDGIAEADSVTMDLHKFGWAPAAAGMFLVRDEQTLRHLSAQATSLNAQDDVDGGFVGLYGTSVQATRRSDALKIAANLAVLGVDGIGDLVDRCCELARHAAARVESEPLLDLAEPPVLSTVLFRYLPPDGRDADAFNAELRRRLATLGRALMARTWSTEEDGSRVVRLKLMLLNPATTTAQLDELIDTILATAAEMTG
ncbi:L-2,4-diaminobutyrate decarboxylase [Actinorhabdospora filicis]|uniref:L-2,4-diaminobutyrate decarboxylase n=1 Tax=Actinorhabdospora filicis TaxID=1785913 RepID=A0A9W6SM21_9ACTN|nr:pyridoxal-dependent decarboxylase [Actinorhabdospora filicis]GLZ78272.1 L-2,4-diaminobutyrate decarboxylase [Actinorhabdospora filicis]